MTIYAANGAKLFIGGPLASKSTDFVLADYAAQTSLWTEIGETEGLGSLGDTSAEITFQGISANRDRRLKGTRNAGTMEIVCGLDYADAGQIDLLAAEKARGEYAFKLVLNDAPAGGTPSERYFVASVASAVEALDAANNVMKLQASLWVNSNIVKVDAEA
jgi:hypothetical protein